ncbi:MAG: alpha/beta hydrolase [Hyphomicrobiales bacterium]|nr:alpha/beta hydrolase [Hyphomicrobiales bacterium]MCP4999136.1 alpha/beta hydrolase [Hyphomicrobiales bacterium]
MIKPAFAIILSLCSTTALAVDLPENFDYIGPTVSALEEADGKTLYYIDEGEKDWTPVVFFGGSGTSVAVFGITEFLRTLRNDLKLRIISVERDGFGQTALSKGHTYQDYADEVVRVLDHLGVAKTALVGISGGGPYLAATAEKLGDRVTSVHMLATYSQYDPGDPDTSGLCKMSEAEIVGAAGYYAGDPVAWWTLGENSPTAKIPGFTDASRNDGARTFSMRGQKMDGAALLAEFNRFCTAKVADLSGVNAPAFIYYGEADDTVKPVHAEFWQGAFPNIAKVRAYAGEGHDIQYRHWDQVLLDMAGMDDQIAMCVDGSSVLISEADAASTENSGGSIGICAWKD